MNLFSVDLIKTHYYAFDKKSVLREMVEFLAEKHIVSDEEDFFAAIMEREKLMSTGIGRKIAIPHARHDSIQQLKIAIFQLDNEIDFAAIDEQKVKLIFMICIPETMKKEYMKILSLLSNFFQSEENREQLFYADSPEDFITILKELEL